MQHVWIVVIIQLERVTCTAIGHLILIVKLDRSVDGVQSAFVKAAQTGEAVSVKSWIVYIYGVYLFYEVLINNVMYR